ncbi:penicillin-binding protein 1A [Larsenimonas salina]|uniref:penicillin-binding protein 1A n=1 Tax=Larsenimonas salina TaxID=1295565 RepID=UPI0020740BEC|nr:PBP1A family penicillin-binding protein [Larsenimonas salina]MCM5704157.1 PBP1A family penicillin-binding protein [Larsenimonas salina]
MKFFRRFVFRTLFFVLSLTAGVALSVTGAAIYFAPGLPDVHQLQDYQLEMPLRVFTDDGKMIGEFGSQRRQLVHYDDMPKEMVEALMAAEDSGFFHHPGIDPKGLLRAFVQLGVSGDIQSGGSTITMQVARNYLLTLDQTFTRKIREILLSLQMEQILSKQQIMELYVNKIYLGQGAYGIGAASQTYFDKPIGELSLPQMATIAGLPKAPSSLNPVSNPSRSLIRRNWILLRMKELGYIDDARYQKAVNTPIEVARHEDDTDVKAPYIAEMARQYAVEHFGNKAYTGGYQITTTIDSKQQTEARQALVKGLIDYDTRHGWRGVERKDIPQRLAEAQSSTDRRGLEEELSASPEVEQTARQAAERSQTTVSGIDGDVSNWVNVLEDTPTYGPLEPAIVINNDGKQMRVLTKRNGVVTLPWQGLSWAREFKSTKWRGPAPTSASDIAHRGDLIRVMKQEDHWRLAQVPDAESAIVVLDPQSGAVRALQGGFNFRHSEFNRATQARRQAGSNFKPFIYLSALENGGMTPGTIINDAPIVQGGPKDGWRPENAERNFLGPTRLRVGLYRSRNLVSVRTLDATGIDVTIQLLEKMGFKKEQLPHGLSLALGSASISPLELARGYAEIANGGYRITPWFIQRVQKGDDGENLLDTTPAPVACPECDPTQNTVEFNGRLHPVAERIASEDAVYMLRSMMEDVINKGTGHAAQSLGRDDLAGKTGTSNDQRDAWFSGFNSDLVASVWVGKDSNETTGEYGAQAALPIWMDFMGKALSGTPSAKMPRPDDIVTARIDPTTGKRLHDGDPGGVSEIFPKDRLPPYQERAVQPELEDQSGSQGTGSYDAIF